MLYLPWRRTNNYIPFDWVRKFGVRNLEGELKYVSTKFICVGHDTIEVIKKIQINYTYHEGELSIKYHLTELEELEWEI